MPCGAAAHPRRRTVVISWSRIPAMAVEWHSQRAAAPYALYQLAGSTPAVIIPMGRVGHGFRDWRRRFDDLSRPGCACEQGGGQQGCCGEISEFSRHLSSPWGWVCTGTADAICSLPHQAATLAHAQLRSGKNSTISELNRLSMLVGTRTIYTGILTEQPYNVPAVVKCDVMAQESLAAANVCASQYFDMQDNWSFLPLAFCA